MKIPIYQVDAFAERLFSGNPAAICPLKGWLPEGTMQAIAAENNLSETAFFVPADDSFELRWFTPKCEVDLCGHATLATAFVIFFEEPDRGPITFSTRSGELTVRKNGDFLLMNFPVLSGERISPPLSIVERFGDSVVDCFMAEDIMIVLDSEDAVRSIDANEALLKKLQGRGSIFTARSRDNNFDFISRFFAPSAGIAEDPVTGSAHCLLTPYWTGVLGKTKLRAKQVSARGGVLECELKGDRVDIAGSARLFSKGEIFLEDCDCE